MTATLQDVESAESARETLWSERFAQRTHGVTSSAIRELLKLTETPEIVSFAGGLPAPEVFPLEAVGAAAQRVLKENGRAALQYGTTEGYLPLRELLVRHMSRYGIHVTPDNVLITSGSQQALDLVGKVFLNPGDHVVTEEPTFLGALQAWNAYQAQYLPVPIDDDGLRMDHLAEALRAGPKLLYVLPNFQNPSGVTLSLERRHALIDLACRYGVPIVEDDPYGQLRYEGEHLPALVRIDAELHRCARGERAFHGGVLYLGTLSKTLAPGLRLGWVVAPEAVIRKLVQMKQGADLHTSTLNQMVAYEVARGGFLDEHVRRIRRVYAERRDAMLEALQAHFPPGVRWTRPQGGLFLWVTLPSGVDATRLLRDALREKVAFVPGAAFFPLGGGAETLRLNFSYCTPERIREGVRRLGRVLAQHVSLGAMGIEIPDPTAALERGVSLTCSTVRTVRGFDLDRVLGDPRPVLVAFETDGNLPCVLLAPSLEEVANEFGRRVLIVRVPDAGDATMAARYHLLWIPTLAFWRGGREILRLAGAAPTEAIRACLRSLLDQRPFPEPVLGPRRAVRSAFHPTQRPPKE